MDLIRALDDATERRLKEHGQLQYFEAQRFAQVLEQGIARAREKGLSHLKAEMNLDDAGRLAAFIRRAILLGA